MNVESVNQFIGMDWVYKTNDCWAVLCKASKAVFGVEIHEIKIPEQSCETENSMLFESNSEKAEWVRRDKPAPGFAALFRGRSGRAVHIGLCITKSDILHCHGSPKRAGKTALDEIKILNRLYAAIEFYEYNPDHDS